MTFEKLFVYGCISAFLILIVFPAVYLSYVNHMKDKKLIDSGYGICTSLHDISKQDECVLEMIRKEKR